MSSNRWSNWNIYVPASPKRSHWLLKFFLHAFFNGVARPMHIKGRLLDQAMILFNCIPFKMGTSLKKNLLPEGANSFLYEQFLIVWKITFITSSDLPWMLPFLLRTCVICVMGATPLLFCHLLIFWKNSFWNYYQQSVSLDPDQAQHFVGPDLGPNCLQRWADNYKCHQQAND